MSVVSIVLFKDGSLQLFANPVESHHFAEGAKCYEVLETTHIIDICEWIGKGYKETSSIYRTW